MSNESGSNTGWNCESKSVTSISAAVANGIINYTGENRSLNALKDYIKLRLLAERVEMHCNAFREFGWTESRVIARFNHGVYIQLSYSQKADCFNIHVRYPIGIQSPA